jgi:hypothetical protein
VFAPLQCGNFKNLAGCRSAELDISKLSAQYLSDIVRVGRNDFAQVLVKLNFQFRKYFCGTLWIGTALVSAGAPAAPSLGAQSPESVFNCTNLASGVGWQIKINFQASTVDSNPARISSSTISWHDPTGSYSLDRSSGNLTVVIASSTGGYFIHDRCRPRG